MKLVKFAVLAVAALLTAELLSPTSDGRRMRERAAISSITWSRTSRSASGSSPSRYRGGYRPSFRCRPLNSLPSRSPQNRITASETPDLRTRKDAPILILDEPTSALDARSEGFLLDALHRLMRGRTTFVIAHRLSTIRNANRILVLDRGEIVEHGRHAELMIANGLYARLYRQQMDVGDGLQPLDSPS